MKRKLFAGLLSGVSILTLGALFNTAMAGVHYPTNQMHIEMNGQTINSPDDIAVKENGNYTTYVPVWYLMTTLKKIGIQSNWDGKNLSLTIPSSFQTTTDLSNIKPGKGAKGIIFNKHDIQNVDSIVYPDPSTHKDTTFFPIYYVMKVLKYVKIDSNWNGKVWAMHSATTGSTGDASSTPTNISQQYVPTHPSVSSITWASGQVTVLVNGQSAGNVSASGQSVSNSNWSDTNAAIAHVGTWKWTYVSGMNAFEMSGTASFKTTSGTEIDQISAFIKEQSGQWNWNTLIDNQTKIGIQGTNQSTKVTNTHQYVDYFAAPSSATSN